MLYITINQSGTAGVLQREFHVGGPLLDYEAKEIVQQSDVEVIIQADGDELAYIKEYFQNIPSCRNPVQIWTGDIAKFIALNLK